MILPAMRRSRVYRLALIAVLGSCGPDEASPDEDSAISDAEDATRLPQLGEICATFDDDERFCSPPESFGRAVVEGNVGLHIGIAVPGRAPLYVSLSVPDGATLPYALSDRNVEQIAHNPYFHGTCRCIGGHTDYGTECTSTGFSGKSDYAVVEDGELRNNSPDGVAGHMRVSVLVHPMASESLYRRNCTMKCEPADCPARTISLAFNLRP